MLSDLSVRNTVVVYESPGIKTDMKNMRNILDPFAVLFDVCIAVLEKLIDSIKSDCDLLLVVDQNFLARRRGSDFGNSDFFCLNIAEDVFYQCIVKRQTVPCCRLSWVAQVFQN